jgi:flavorubredoxin
MEAVLRRPTKLRWTRVTTWILQKEDAQFLKNLSGSHLNLFLIKSKDSILRQFDISQINDFFPEYEKEIKKVLDRS